MANEASYVPLGRDNTGAAVQLNPFDSSKIFAAYDKANAPVKTPLLDSYGKDLSSSTSGVDPVDRWWVDESKKNETEYLTKIYQGGKEITGEQRIQADKNRAETKDRLSLAQKHMEIANEWEKKISSNPYLYPADAKQKLLKWKRETPINERMQTLGPDIQALPKTTSYDILKTVGGDASQVVDRTWKNPNGSGGSKKVVEFDPEKAERDWIQFGLPMVTNPNSEKGRILVAQAEDELEELAPKYGYVYSEMTPEQKADLTIESIHNDFIETKRSNVKVKDARTNNAEQDSDSKTGKKKSNQPLVYDVNLGVAYKNVGENDEIQPTGTRQEKGNVEIVNVVEVPVKNDQFEELNKEIKFKKGKNYVIGTVENVRKYANKKGDWQEEVWATVVDKEGSSKEILLTGENLKAFKENYNFDPIELIERKRSSWENREVDIPKPEDMPDWNAKSPADQAQLKSAYQRKIKASTPTPPKEKGALQKGIDMVKGFFSTTPAKTTKKDYSKYKR